VQEDLDVLLQFLMDVKENHPSAMYSSGIDPENVKDLESMLEQVRMGVVHLLCVSLVL